MNILSLTSWGKGAWAEFKLYIVSNKPFYAELDLRRPIAKATHCCIINGIIMVFPKHPFGRTFSNPAANNASQDECEWFSACHISRCFTVFHCKKRRSRPFHGIFTLFTWRLFCIAKLSGNPRKSKTLSIKQLQHFCSRLWKADVSATSTTKPCGYYLRPHKYGQPNQKHPACKQRTFPKFHGRFLKAFLLKAPESQGVISVSGSSEFFIISS